LVIGYWLSGQVRVDLLVLFGRSGIGLVIGYPLLVISYWLSVIGYWLSGQVRVGLPIFFGITD